MPPSKKSGAVRVYADGGVALGADAAPQQFRHQFGHPLSARDLADQAENVGFTRAIFERAAVRRFLPQGQQEFLQRRRGPPVRSGAPTPSTWSSACISAVGSTVISEKAIPDLMSSRWRTVAPA